MKTTLSIRQVRGFANATAELGAYNLVIGANGAGKSTLVGCCQFLADALEYGLSSALDQQGGLSDWRRCHATKGPLDGN